MNQAILKIIDEMIDKNQLYYESVNPRSPMFLIDSERYKGKQNVLRELNKEISSLPSDTQWIDTLQRYNVSLDWWEYNHDNWEYVKYSDLVNLLKNDIP